MIGPEKHENIYVPVLAEASSQCHHMALNVHNLLPIIWTHTTHLGQHMRTRMYYHLLGGTAGLFIAVRGLEAVT